MNKCVIYICNDVIPYTMFLKHSIKTLLLFNNVDIFILTNKFINFSNNIKIKQINTLKYQNEVSLFDSIITPYNKVVFYKLLIPLIAELKKYDKILYLDTDTEVCGTLDEIFQIKNNSMISAVSALN